MKSPRDESVRAEGGVALTRSRLRGVATVLCGFIGHIIIARATSPHMLLAALGIKAR
eukprot:COSAG02_NODE_4486_length_5301_cov_3.420223_5_plen_57_part_00